jgi:hypothetical protein
MAVIPATQEGEIVGGLCYVVSPGKVSMRPCLKTNFRKRALAVIQVVEHLPSKCEALSSNSSTALSEKNWGSDSSGRGIAKLEALSSIPSTWGRKKRKKNLNSKRKKDLKSIISA